MIRRVPLEKYWVSMLVATLLALVLAGSASLVGILIGPCLKLLLSGSDGFSSWQSLVGPTLEPLAVKLSGMSGIAASDLWTTIPLWLLILASIKTLAHLIQWHIWEWTGERMARDLRGNLIHSVVYLDPQLRNEDETQGEARLASVLSTDIKFVQEWFVRMFGGLPREFLLIVAYVMTLWALSPRLLAIFSLGVLPMMLIVSKIGKRLHKRATAALRNTEGLTEWIQQRLMGAETIKFYGQESQEQLQLKSMNLQLFKKYESAARSKARTGPVMEVIAMISLAVVFYLSAQEIQSGRTSAAACLSFFTTLGLLSQAAGKLGRYVNVTKVGDAAWQRIEELSGYLKERQRINVGPQFVRGAKGENSVSCSDLIFRYTDQGPNVLRGVSCDFRTNKVYAICGASGAGKSTLLNLLLGLIEPQEGQIKFQMNLDDFTNDSLHVGFVPQKVELFSGTIAQNIIYPANLTDQRKLDDVLTYLRLTDLSNALGTGEENDQTLTLSGGQAQRVLLARMLYHKPPVVLIDEGTSGLDTESEQLIHQALRKLADDGAIVVMISHRLASLEFADEVVYLQNGEVKQQGALMDVQTNADFRALFSQA